MNYWKAGADKFIELSTYRAIRVRECAEVDIKAIGIRQYPLQQLRVNTPSDKMDHIPDVRFNSSNAKLQIDSSWTGGIFRALPNVAAGNLYDLFGSEIDIEIDFAGDNIA